MICGVCRRPRARSSCEILTLTDKERELEREKLGFEPPKEYIYCQSCYRTLTTQKTAAPFWRGMMAVRYRAFGVQEAERLADNYINQIVKATPDTKPS